MKNSCIPHGTRVLGICFIIYGIALCAYGLNKMAGLDFSYLEMLVIILVWVVASMVVSAHKIYTDYEEQRRNNQ